MNTLLFTLLAAFTLGTSSMQMTLLNTSAPTVTQQEFTTITDFVPVDEYSDNIAGTITAPVSIITWMDYECPFCAQFHSVLEEYRSENQDTVRVIYRHYPLSFHEHALDFAQAAECIAEQGGMPVFIKFSSIVFNDGADYASMEDYITQADAKPEYVFECMKSGRPDTIIQKHIADANESGLFGTPHTIVVNEETDTAIVLQGAVSKDVLDSAIRFVQ